MVVIQCLFLIMNMNLYICYVCHTGCSFCKRLKPDYAEAASELKGDYVSTYFSIHFAFKYVADRLWYAVD